MSIFIDTFQGHCKDGTDRTRDYRAASSIHLLCIFQIIFVCIDHYSRPHILEYVQPGFMIVSLFYALVRPYKQEYANMIQSILYALTAFVLFTASSARFHKHSFFPLSPCVVVFADSPCCFVCLHNLQGHHKDWTQFVIPTKSVLQAWLSGAKFSGVPSSSVLSK